ncbi:helix-turn-helix transcriptional regulator [Asticcacaulis sp. BYS171W]|uniref:Helix-turn-helix transcriptional regulator n=1 Tax=Asticcacaulis aquaticus TaxID=2984212 RepID=A0ABT5HU72_9CAUL|nr:helix-turn-helix transcriptional regulator [Asticcacaulis aquaticus]MDC7683498.1 helix-turn-helix transcriptional regulator [Asticcacaulis aquaticus]
MVRRRRKELGMSQDALGDALDLTFQQVQKYERGANRISASKLYETSQALKVPVDYFFRGVEAFPETEVAESEITVSNFLISGEGLEMAEAFPKLSPVKRRSIVGVVKAVLADQDTDA